jgi:hypothetical protein
MLVDLCRTFSDYKTTANESDEQDWSHFLGRQRGGHIWSEIHEKPLTMILGEAGIGKTVELKYEVDRLRAAGKAAFFLPLNLLSDAESWHLVLAGWEDEYAGWAASGELGYFFLDAVDEARLRAHSDFEKALAVVRLGLASNLERVRIAISSRVTDWSSSAVRAAVASYLAEPIARATATKTPDVPSAESRDDAPTVQVRKRPDQPTVETFVVALDPLSNAEARRCAEAFAVEDASGFWAAVNEGDYEFMATRPLDLRWMVELWNQRRTLGTYQELIDANIANRLRELNPSYEAGGEALSLDDLRSGAMELAAAAEFGGRAFFILDPAAPSSAGELAPERVLTSWKPLAVRRLLGTAVFDEASYGRVKFHHRSVREYLAAQWVAKQVGVGVPLQRIQGLFSGRPFGEHVLVPSRRAALAWLAAINVGAREWVVRDFPELLLYEGDPQAWDALSADKAFANYIEASRHGLQTDWYNSASESMRVGRALSPGRVAGVLRDAGAPQRARSHCFQIARAAKLRDCAEVVFDIYRDTAARKWERSHALDALEQIGTEEHRAAVLTDLKSLTLDSSELIAGALSAADWRGLSVSELSAVFNSTREKESYGPMVRVIKEELLPTAEVAAATLLLTAVMASMPRPVPGKRFARFPECDRPERAWLLEVLPDCYERLLSQLPGTDETYADICLEAAERLEAQRDSGFTDSDDFARISKAVSQHPVLRWSVALAIAQSEDIRYSVSRLAWGTHCLVSFDADDLPELTRRANDQASLPEEREVWFTVALEIAFRRMRGHTRAVALRALGVQSTGSARGAIVGTEYLRCCRGARQNRVWQSERMLQKAEAAQRNQEFKAELRDNLAHIRDGSHEGALRSLLRHSFHRSKQRSYSDVDFEELAVSLSPEIATAFEEGLKAYWPNVAPPHPADYSNGQVPWAALIALAGLRLSLKDINAASRLPASDVVKAAQLAVWELGGFPDWFNTLVRAHPAAVESALGPWVLEEAQSQYGGDEVHGVLNAALRCPSEIRGVLLARLAPLVSNNQITQRKTLLAVIDALREDHFLTGEVICDLCQAKLEESIGPEGRLSEKSWLRVWMGEDAPAAWSWFVRHVGDTTGDVALEVSEFAAALDGLKWVKSPLDQPTANVLVSMHEMLGAHLRNAAGAAAAGDGDFFGPPSKRLRDSIPNLFVATRGPIGHQGLVDILPAYADLEARNWIRARVTEHASLDLAAVAARSYGELKAIGSPFLTPPRSEAQLFQQVIARLEEIRKNLEEGPFSERDLFSAGMREKYLQRWLAAKFRETQNRRFSVHREEEVDDDNMTDIQLSCAAGNVCVEIKPVDATRYSANSLTGTLKTQIVGQYLRGTNSSRGILVLMQLDDKGWNIPGGPNGQPFSALVEYLQVQANLIKQQSPGVNELVVFCLRCIV